MSDEQPPLTPAERRKQRARLRLEEWRSGVRRPCVPLDPELPPPPERFIALLKKLESPEG
jgi:hypothetical protein